MKAEIRDAEAADVLELMRSLRECDRIELRLADPWADHHRIIEESYTRSDVCLACLGGGRLFCLAGAAADTAMSGTASLWMLGTDAISAPGAAALFLRGSRAVLRRIARATPRVHTYRNAVWTGNSAAVRWLDWLGARFTGESERSGAVFAHFEFLREDVLPELREGGGDV